jgi:hypothetical protein
MTDPQPPGSNICAEMRYSEDGREEICTFRSHDHSIAHFFEDYQHYYDLVMGYYDQVTVNNFGNLPADLVPIRALFIYKCGVALQRLQVREGMEERDPGEDSEPAKPAGPRPPDPTPEQEGPPRLRIVRNEDVHKELGICGKTKIEDGEVFICLAPTAHKGECDWMNYEVAVDTAEHKMTIAAIFSRSWWKNRLDIITGRLPRVLPPYGQNLESPVPPPEDPDDTPEPPPLPPTPIRSEPIPDYPKRPESPEEERRKSFDPERGGGHVGSRGPGTNKWDRARRDGANWEEADDGAARVQTPEAKPLEDHQSGIPMGAGLGRRRDQIASRMGECGLLKREGDALFVCRKEIGHMAKYEGHRFVFYKNLSEEDD